MQTIWKFPLAVTDEQVIYVPKITAPLTVQVQDGVLMLWVRVSGGKGQPVKQIVRIYGTGNPIPEGNEQDEFYLASVQQDGFVWHVYWVVMP